jgi:hypothetical protein
MRGARFVAALVLAAVMLTGCAGPLFRPDEAQEVAGLLADYRRVAALPADEQRRQVLAAQAAYDKAPSDATRLALALAMLLPQVSVRDEARLQALLGSVAAGTGGHASARYDLAQTLLAFVAASQRKQDLLAHQLREERRRGEEMQQKIESLRAIDRDIRSRRNAQ